MLLLQSNHNSSNTVGSFTMANANSSLFPLNSSDNSTKQIIKPLSGRTKGDLNN